MRAKRLYPVFGLFLLGTAVQLSSQTVSIVHSTCGADSCYALIAPGGDTVLWDGSLVQMIVDGAGDGIDLPSWDGSPGGDDFLPSNAGSQWAANGEAHEAPGNFWSPTAIAYPAQGSGDMALQGDSIYLRVFDGPTIQSSMHYANSVNVTNTSGQWTGNSAFEIPATPDSFELGWRFGDWQDLQDLLTQTTIVPVSLNEEASFMTRSYAARTLRNADGLSDSLFLNPVDGAILYYPSYPPELVLFVADRSLHRILYVGLDQRFGDTVRTWGSWTQPFEEPLAWPTAVDVNISGFMVVGDRWLRRLNLFSFDSTTQRIILTNTVDDSDLSGIIDLAITKNKSFYVLSDIRSEVRKYDSTGSLIYAYGHYGYGPDLFVLPKGIASWHDTVYIADTGNNRIVRLRDIDTTLQYIDSWNPMGWDSLTSVAVDVYGDVYVTSTSDGVLIKLLWKDGPPEPIFHFGGTGFGAGRLYKPIRVVTPNFSQGRHPVMSALGVIEAWTDSSGIKAFLVGADIFEYSVSSVPYDYRVHLHFLATAPLSCTIQMVKTDGAVVWSTDTTLAETGRFDLIWLATDSTGDTLAFDQYAVRTIFSSLTKKISSGDPVVSQRIVVDSVWTGLQGSLPPIPRFANPFLEQDAICTRWLNPQTGVCLIPEYQIVDWQYTGPWTLKDTLCRHSICHYYYETGKVYRFRARSVNSLGIRSDYSNTVEIFVPQLLMARPEHLVVKRCATDEVCVHWSPVCCDTLGIHYENIYYLLRKESYLAGDTTMHVSNVFVSDTVATADIDSEARTIFKVWALAGTWPSEHPAKGRGKED